MGGDGGDGGKPKRVQVRSCVSTLGWTWTCQILSGKSHGQRNLVGYSPWGLKESDPTVQLTLSLFFFFHGMLNMGQASLYMHVLIHPPHNSSMSG